MELGTRDPGTLLPEVSPEAMDDPGRLGHTGASRGFRRSGGDGLARKDMIEKALRGLLGDEE